MRVAVEEMEGVTEAEVSLNDGEVRVVMAENSPVTLVRLREVIRQRGFTPRDADVHVRGVPERRAERWIFRVSATGEEHRMALAPGVAEEVQSRQGETMTVRGRMAEGTDGPLRIVSIDAGR